MRTPGFLATAMAFALVTAGIGGTADAAPAKKSTAAKAAATKKKAPPPNLWTELNAKLAGKWASSKVMAKGYVAKLWERASEKHANFGKSALDVLEAINKSFASLGACWPNVRLAFARLLGGAAKGAGQPLATALKNVLAAFTKAATLKDGKPDAVVGPIMKALNAAKRTFKAGSPYRKALFGAGVWLRKPCNLHALKGGDDKAKPKAKTPMPKVKVD